MRALGVSAFYHDSAAALVEDGHVVAAAQEERFTRIKHDSSFPRHAVKYCLEEARCSLDDIDYVVFYDKPLLKFERLLETYVAVSPRGFGSFQTSMPVWLNEKLFLPRLIEGEMKEFGARPLKNRLLFNEHHMSHAMSAFYPSPFDEAAILVLDGVGEWATSSVGIGRGSSVSILKEIHFPHSLGLLYSAFTYYLGFKVNSGEYKVMGLAPYGAPRFAQLIFDEVIDLKPDGSFFLDQRWFDYCAGLTMTSAKFDALFGGPPRRPDDPLVQKHMDIAASIQAVTDEAVLRLTRSIAKETGQRNLCMAGGVALNCVTNGKVLRDGRFEEIWIQPAAGDAGGAIGAALAACHFYSAQPRIAPVAKDGMSGSFLGPSFGDGEIVAALTQAGARYELLSDDALLERAAADLADGKAIGWMQGRMEFGPRALGNRSILADPRSPRMQRDLNLKVKFRESFRPFAPAVLAEHADAYFEIDRSSPYMLFVADVRPERRRLPTGDEAQLCGIDLLNVTRSDIPAVTHVDFSARVQTVEKADNPLFHGLLTAFHALTGCPVLVNTSFNVRGEPIVCSPADAFRCFMGTDLDALYVGNYRCEKLMDDRRLATSHRHAFAAD